ncbi:MAG: rane protein [Bacilli bacterium]|jgi:putative membrane protein|nr:rane protein [Bacilli bacterium]
MHQYTNLEEVALMHILGAIVRFIVSALVLLFVGWIVPNFVVGGFWSAFFLAIVIAVLAWIIEGIFGKNITPFGRGIVGFLTSALIIWLAQFIVSGVRVTIIGAILAALIIGIIDIFIPVGDTFNTNSKRRRTAK